MLVVAYEDAPTGMTWAYICIVFAHLACKALMDWPNWLASSFIRNQACSAVKPPSM